jgi:hypothetical protein
MTQCHSDPQGTRTDAELISSLQRAWLLPREGHPDPAVEAKFSLDSAVGDEGTLTSTCSSQQLLIFSPGANFSAGEKQLLALCRALVKNSRIIVLVRCFLNPMLNRGTHHFDILRMKLPVAWTSRLMLNYSRRSRQSSPNQLCCALRTD